MIFLNCIPDSDTHRPALLDLFLTSDPGLCSVEAFLSFSNSDHVVVYVSINFAVSSKKDASYHRKVFDYSGADWDSFRDHLRDVPKNDI